MLAQIVLILALLLILVGMVMMLLEAFSESLFWGLLVLLLMPIFGPIFCFIKWNKSRARNGLAMSVVGLVMAAVGIYGGGADKMPVLEDQEIVKNLPSALPPDEPLPNEEAAAKIVIEGEGEYDPLLSTDKDRFSTQEIEPLAPQEDKTVTGAGLAKNREVKLDIADINTSIGSYIEVMFLDGTKKSGKLAAATSKSISLEEQISGGFASFEYRFKKIESILLLAGPSNTPAPLEVKKQESELEAEPALELNPNIETTESTNLVTPGQELNIDPSLPQPQMPTSPDAEEATNQAIPEQGNTNYSPPQQQTPTNPDSKLNPN